MQTGEAIVARSFLAALPTGSFPADMFTEDATLWTTSGGAKPIAGLLAGAALLARVFGEPLRYDIVATTQQEDRLVAEVRATGVLVSGEAYRADQVFILRFRDGRIAAVAEHNNPILVQEKLGPLLAQVMAARTV